MDRSCGIVQKLVSACSPRRAIILAGRLSVGGAFGSMISSRKLCIASNSEYRKVFNIEFIKSARRAIN